MAQELERHDAYTEEVEHPAYYCDCGRGFSIENTFGVGAGDPCDLCGRPLTYAVMIEMRRQPSLC